MKVSRLLLALLSLRTLIAAPELITSAEITNRPMGVSGGAEISADGRFVFFQSTAPNLAAPAAVGNFMNFFRRDLQSQTTVLVTQNTNASAAANDHCLDFAFSADGDAVVFSSKANNLVANDTDAVADIFLRVISSNLTVRLSAPKLNVTNYRRASSSPTISEDGQRIAFSSFASDIDQPPSISSVPLFYIHDRTNGLTRQITSRPLNSANAATSAVSNPFLTRNGQRVVFEFNGPNLAGAGATYGTNVFLYELGIETNLPVTFVSSNAMTVLGRDQTTRANSLLRGVSADGNVVVFLTDIPNSTSGASTNYLLRSELLTGLTEVIATNINRLRDASAVNSDVALSADGRFLAYALGPNIYRWDGLNHLRELVSVTLGNTAITGTTNVAPPVMTSNGRFVLFTTAATNVVSPEAPLYPQLYRRDMDAGTTIRVSSDVNTNAVDAQVFDGSISDDGSSVVFTSSFGAFTGGDADGLNCLLWNEPTAPHVSLISTASSEINVRLPFRFLTLSTQPISANGSRVVFSAEHDSGPAFPQIWLRDRTQPSPVLISTNANGVAASGVSQNAMISADGRWIAFQSTATDLDSSVTDTNSTVDVFLQDTQTGSIRLITKAANTDSTPPSFSQVRAISPNGKFLVIMSPNANFTEPRLTTTTGDFSDSIHYVVNTTTGEFSPLSVTVSGAALRARVGEVRFSPDGQYLAATVEGQAAYIDARGGNTTNAFTSTSLTLLLRDLSTGITRGYPAIANLPGVIDFSPDGSYLVTSALAGTNGRAITRINLATGTETKINFGTNRLQEVSVSRNAQRVAVRTHTSTGLTADSTTIRLADFDVLSNDQISLNSDTTNHRQVISPDGQLTFFGSAYADATHTNVTPAVYSYDTDSKALLPFASGDAPTMTPIVSADGSTLLVASSASNLGAEIDVNNAIDLFAYSLPFQPGITISLSANEIELRWPVSATGYIVESSATLEAAANWERVDASPATDNGDLVLRIQVAESARFFRLRK